MFSCRLETQTMLLNQRSREIEKVLINVARVFQGGFSRRCEILGRTDSGDIDQHVRCNFNPSHLTTISSGNKFWIWFTAADKIAYLPAKTTAGCRSGGKCGNERQRTCEPISEVFQKDNWHNHNWLQTKGISAVQGGRRRCDRKAEIVSSSYRKCVFNSHDTSKHRDHIVMH